MLLRSFLAIVFVQSYWILIDYKVHDSYLCCLCGERQDVNGTENVLNIVEQFSSVFEWIKMGNKRNCEGKTCRIFCYGIKMNSFVIFLGSTANNTMLWAFSVYGRISIRIAYKYRGTAVSQEQGDVMILVQTGMDPKGRYECGNFMK